MWSNNRSQHPHPFVMHACIIDTQLASAQAQAAATAAATRCLQGSTPSWRSWVWPSWRQPSWLCSWAWVWPSWRRAWVWPSWRWQASWWQTSSPAGASMAAGHAQGTAAGAGVSVHVHKCRWVASYSGTGAKASKLQRRQASLSGAHDIAGGACCCPYQNSSARQQAHSTTMQSTRHCLG